MRIPKHFELHLATGETEGMQMDVIRVSEDGQRLLATDGVVAASVPITDDLGRVQREVAERLPPGATISAKAWAEAARGTNGEGTLRLQPEGQIAQSAPHRPALLFPEPTLAEGQEAAPVETLLGLVASEYARPEIVTVDLLLDAEALHRLARALGTTEEEGLRIRIPLRVQGNVLCGVVAEVVTTTGLHVEPAEGGGAWGIIMPISREGR